MRYVPFLVLAVSLMSGGAPAAVVTFEVAKASVTLPVVYETTNGSGERVLATRKLKTADVVNLALGRPLTTKLDKATETLAFAADATTPGAGSQIVVFNPSTQTITATVAEFGGDFVLRSNEDFSKNVAFSSVIIQTTTAGTPAQNGFQTTTIAGAGTGKPGSASATVFGPVKFTATDASNVTTTIDGVVTKGKFKAGGFLAVLF